MLKTSRNISVDLRRRRSFVNLEEINMGSCITIAAVIIILVLSVLLFASYPNSNIPVNI
jgi:hypothetical protein